MSIVFAMLTRTEQNAVRTLGLGLTSSTTLGLIATPLSGLAQGTSAYWVQLHAIAGGIAMTVFLALRLWRAGSRRKARNGSGVAEQFHVHESGNVALIGALVAPALALLSCGAVDLASVWSDRGSLQDAVDNAALSAAKQMGVTSADDRTARAQLMIESSVPDVYERLGVSVTAATTSDPASVTVSASGHRPSFFGNLLPPGGWPVKVSATASPGEVTPLCVLHITTASTSPLKMQSTASIKASDCRVTSNTGIVNGGTGWLRAKDVQAAGTASGNISPAALTSAPVLPDPFASDVFPIPTSCSGAGRTYTSGTITIPAGVHCGGIQLNGTAKGVLAPGDHIFVGGDLAVQQNASLKGSDVVLAFGANDKFKFVGGSTVDLEGRHTGPFAGFLIVTDRANGNNFTIQSKNVTRLYGTIYMPAATLSVSGSGGGQVAQQSAWTVVVVNQLQTVGSQELVINSNYTGASVPVPGGVGSGSSGQVRLVN